MTGAKAHALNANVFYGRTTGSVFGAREDVIVAEAALAGVAVKLIEKPRLHAKVLAWDDDAVVITSLNWLSAASGDLQSLKEIGVFIETKSVAEVVISNFEAAMNGAKQD
jgi:phosphatidylserine/phosphatidylglycerophosphate/cardiolipin synthase-like enzyme